MSEVDIPIIPNYNINPIDVYTLHRTRQKNVAGLLVSKMFILTPTTSVVCCGVLEETLTQMALLFLKEEGLCKMLRWVQPHPHVRV